MAGLSVTEKEFWECVRDQQCPDRGATGARPPPGAVQAGLVSTLINLGIPEDQLRGMTAADVLRESGDADPAHAQRACQQIALLQYLDVLLEHGEEIARDSLKKNPAKMITLMNSICKLSNSELAIEKRNARIAADIPAAPPAYPESSIQLPSPSEPNRTPKK